MAISQNTKFLTIDQHLKKIMPLCYIYNSYLLLISSQKSDCEQIWLNPVNCKAGPDQ